ncbi:Hypothetical protein BN69_2818 [Methylocystis sp. SC2]|nr:Hypothetical protein BN69_2818 [Methylocystis sp. SC2]
MRHARLLPRAPAAGFPRQRRRASKLVQMRKQRWGRTAPCCKLPRLNFYRWSLQMLLEKSVVRAARGAGAPVDFSGD